MERLQFLRLLAREYAMLVKKFKVDSQLSDSRDVVNKAVLDILRRKSYKSIDIKKGSPVGWLVQCVKRQKQDLERRERLERKLFISLDTINFSEVPFSSEAFVLGSESVEVTAEIRLAFAKLTPLQQYVVKHIYLGNESYASLSGLLEMDEQPVREAGRVAREILREALGK